MSPAARSIRRTLRTPASSISTRPQRNAQGLVEYEIDLDILRPVDPARASGVVLYEVTNRGNKLIGRLNGVVPANPLNPTELNDPVTRAHAGTGFLFERGLTLVWSGWDPTVRKPQCDR